MNLKHLFACTCISLLLVGCLSQKHNGTCDDVLPEEIENSVEYFQEQVKLNPMDQQAQYSLGMSYYKLGQYGEAENTFTKLISLNDEYHAAFLNRGMCRLLLSNDNGACEDFTRTVGLGHDPTAIEGAPLSSYISKNCNR